MLDVSRLESGALKPKLDWCDLGDVIEGALAATRERAGTIPCLSPCRRIIRW